MLLSQKCQYALRAIYELARNYQQGPVKSAHIAQVQAIPKNFLAIILNQLKQGGFVYARRGADGGYVLVKEPRCISVGEIIRFIQGPVGPVGCVTDSPFQTCPLKGQCVFINVWKEAEQALNQIFDKKTFQDLVDEHS